MSQPIQTLEQFLSLIFQNQIDDALQLCAEDVCFLGVRPEPSEQVSLYGEYFGHQGARQFFANFTDLITLGEFNVVQRLSDQNHVVMYGNFKHHAKATGKSFHSAWCLVVKFNENHLLQHYHMYEDSAALEDALAIHEQ